MKILFLHGWHSVPGGVKPTYLAQHGNTIINPKLPDEDFAEAVRIAHAEFDQHQPQVVVGSSRGGAVAMNINIGNAKLVLLCPAWKKWGTAKNVKPGTVILHSRADDVIPFADSEELVKNSGLPNTALIQVGNDHRLADPEPLGAMLRACRSSIIEAALTETQSSLLSRFKSVGGCVEFVVFECCEEIESVEIHREVVVASLQSIGRRWDKFATKPSREQKIPIEKFMRLEIDDDKAAIMIPKRISPQEFFGARYDCNTKMFRDKHSLTSSPEGYAYAFSDPPYGLCDCTGPRRLDDSDISSLFDSINREMLGNISSESIIYQWPVDWSNFFDPGQEWWGSFLWTVANPGDGRLIAIAASTTD